MQMQAHILEPPRPQPHKVLPSEAVTPMGTFATGQSAAGSFRVIADADVGSFANGLAASDDAPTTA